MAVLSYDAQWVTLANRALLRIGSEQISALDDGSQQANFCAQLLPQALETVYSSYHWRHASKRVQLAPLSDVPAYGFAYQFSFPSDFALIKSVECLYPYSIDGMRILTDATEVFMSYVALPSNPLAMSPSLRDLVVKQLSYLLSIPILKNDTTSNRIMQEYMQSYSMAITKEGIGQYQEDVEQEWYDTNR